MVTVQWWISSLKCTEAGLCKNRQKVPCSSVKTDITTARGVQLIQFQASSTCCGPSPSSYVVNRWSAPNGGSVVSNVQKLVYAKFAKKVPCKSMKTDITTARGVQLIPFQASSTCCGPPPSSYVVNRWSPSNGGSVVSNVQKLVYAKIAKKCLVAA